MTDLATRPTDAQVQDAHGYLARYRPAGTWLHGQDPDGLTRAEVVAAVLAGAVQVSAAEYWAAGRAGLGTVVVTVRAAGDHSTALYVLPEGVL